MDIMTFFALLVAALLGIAGGFIAQRVITTRRIGGAEALAKRIVEEARKEAQAQKKELVLQGQNDLFAQKREVENELKEREREIKSRERKIDELGERLEERQEKCAEKERDLFHLEKDLAKRERSLAESEEFLQVRIDKQESILSEIAGLTPEEARKRLMADIEAKTRHEAAKMIRQIESEAREIGDRKAKDILCFLRK